MNPWAEMSDPDLAAVLASDVGGVARSNALKEQERRHKANTPAPTVTLRDVLIYEAAKCGSAARNARKATALAAGGSNGGPDTPEPQATPVARRTKRKRLAGLSEKQIQSAIRKALYGLGWQVTSTSQAQRAQMSAGIPDLFCRHPGQQRRLWLEVKRPERRDHARGGCTPEQATWIRQELAAGGEAYVVYGVEDAVRIVTPAAT